MKKTSNLTPDLMEITYGLDSNYQINFHDKGLSFYNKIEKIKTDIKPSNEEWENFWKILDEIKIWEWYPSYETESLIGLEWSIKIKINDKIITSEGINGFPTDGNYLVTPYMSIKFEKFLNALEKLTNQKIETYENDSATEFYPKKLEVGYKVEIEFFTSESYEFKGNQIYYFNNSDRSSILTSKPTTEQWKQFWNKLEELNIWNWEISYEPDLMVLDGYSWNIEIQYKNKKIESTWFNYSNQDLEQLLEALQELIKQ